MNGYHFHFFPKYLVKVMRKAIRMQRIFAYKLATNIANEEKVKNNIAKQISREKTDRVDS